MSTCRVCGVPLRESGDACPWCPADAPPTLLALLDRDPAPAGPAVVCAAIVLGLATVAIPALLVLDRVFRWLLTAGTL